MKPAIGYTSPRSAMRSTRAWTLFSWEICPFIYSEKGTTPAVALRMPTVPWVLWACLSFPSGHTSAAFLMVTLLVLFYGPIFAIFYLWAGSVALSRLVLGVHFPTDVLVGSLLGSSIAFLSFVQLSWKYSTVFKGLATGTSPEQSQWRKLLRHSSLNARLMRSFLGG